MPKKSPSSPSSPSVGASRFSREDNPHPRTPASPLPHSHTSEKSLEHYFCAAMSRLGFPCIKQFNPYEAGWPDRLLVLPDLRVYWIEFKSKGKRPTRLQQIRHKILTDLHHLVAVIDSRDAADLLIEEITALYT